MRVLVMGSTGSGKSTFARQLAARIGAPHIEQDALNWDPGWTDLSQADPEKLRERVRAAIVAESWTTCGNYSAVRGLIIERATHLVWLDYERPIIMARVIRRSISRAIVNAELWPGTGNREDFRRWLDKEHPIRWAWDTFKARRMSYEQMFADPANARLEMHRVRHPRQAAPLMDRLAAAERRPIPCSSVAVPAVNEE
jgi:adenylate kinase family enzyme